jgi:hypothetical protein
MSDCCGERLGDAIEDMESGRSIGAVVLAVLVSQILIFAGTAFSYIAGVNTFFNYPEALNQQAAIGFGAAMGRVRSRCCELRHWSDLRCDRLGAGWDYFQSARIRFPAEDNRNVNADDCPPESGGQRHRVLR